MYLFTWRIVFGFDICIYLSDHQVSLLNNHRLTQLLNFSRVMRTFEIYCLSNFQVCVTVLWAGASGDPVLRCSVKSRASLSCLGQAVRTCIRRMSGEAQTRCVSVSGGELLHVPGAVWSARRRARRAGPGSASADSTATRSKHPPAPRCCLKVSPAYRFSPRFPLLNRR